MERESLIDRIKQGAAIPPGVARPPPAELVAFAVHVERSMMGWKQSTLAEFAKVSLSTVERVERGDRVSVEALDKIGLALGHDAGHFTSARIPLSNEEGAKALAESWGQMEPVDVARLETQRQVRELLKCDAMVFHGFPEDESVRDLAEGLFEWLDFTAFILSDLGSDPQERRARRRARYADILREVARIDALGYWVLAGSVTAPTDITDSWTVGVISVRSKKHDLAGGSRKVLFVDRRHWKIALPEEAAAT